MTKVVKEFSREKVVISEFCVETNGNLYEKKKSGAQKHTISPMFSSLRNYLKLYSNELSGRTHLRAQL